jgi:hypothetical protein
MNRVRLLNVLQITAVSICGSVPGTDTTAAEYKKAYQESECVSHHFICAWELVLIAILFHQQYGKKKDDHKTKPAFTK